MTDDAEKFELSYWKTVEGSGGTVKRFPIPAGWIYQCYEFVPANFAADGSYLHPEHWRVVAAFFVPRSTP